MADDKRRIPYNIWINVLGAIFFLLIASIGTFVFSIGYYADQKAVSEKEYCNHNEVCWGNYRYTYLDNETRSDWKDLLCRILVGLIGIVIIILGIVAWGTYSTEHYWHIDDKCKIK